MYEELVKSLRELCEMTALCDEHSCFECPYEEKCSAYKNGILSAVYGLAADAIEELSKPRWIPVTERLPKYGERVLVFGGVTMYVAYYDKNRYGGESWHKLNSKSHYCNPTHWMPLPQPPKEE